MFVEFKVSVLRICTVINDTQNWITDYWHWFHSGRLCQSTRVVNTLSPLRAHDQIQLVLVIRTVTSSLRGRAVR
jgi:hypothetical protein